MSRWTAIITPRRPAAGQAHGGESIDLPAGPGTPTLELSVDQGHQATGWNLHIATTNFRFAPERANAPHRPGEGHAHVYVDGRKIARVYGPWFHLDALPPGGATVAVTLTANDHRTLAVAGRPLRAERRIAVE